MPRKQNPESLKHQKLPTVETVSTTAPKPSKTTTSTAVSTTCATSSTTHAVSCQVPCLPTGITIPASRAGPTGTLPSHVPIPTAGITGSSSSSSSSAAAAATGAIPGHMAILAAGETLSPSTTAATPVTKSIAVVPPITVSVPSPAAIAAVTPPRSQINRPTARGGDVGGLGLVAVEDDGELDHLALAQGAVSVGFDRGLVDEQILAAFVGLDEAVAFLVIEPGHDALGSC
ncbi:ABC-2 type transporter family protein [Striga asiatica]|uniref:ABC-2 type transporter family protein n=1 Tax=Striga asiatica TaxID=4170 RepID=A0A5A7RD34_STRAF|nr:ABC-2 type transporter family protein [Striga asiatica]